MPTKNQTINPLRAITGYNANSPLRMAGLAQGGAALVTDVGDIASGNVQAQSAKGEGGRILGDVGKYAAMGAAAGPIGAGVGALVGLTVGLVKNKKAKEAYAEEQEEITKQTNAANARARLNANVNMAKQQETQSNIKKMEHEDKAPTMMSHLKMSHLKKGYSTLQMGHESKVQMGHSDLKKSDLYNKHYSDMKKLAPIPYGSEMKMSVKSQASSDMMMKVSGVSDLMSHEPGHVSYSGPQIQYGEDGEPTGVHSATKQVTVFKGQKGYKEALASAQQKKNRAMDAAEAKAKAAAEKEQKAKLKENTEIANKRAKANVEASKTT